MRDIVDWSGKGYLWKDLSIYEDGDKFVLELCDSVIGYIKDRSFSVPKADGIDKAIEEIQTYDWRVYSELD